MLQCNIIINEDERLPLERRRGHQGLDAIFEYAGNIPMLRDFTAKPTGRFFYHKVPPKFVVVENTKDGRLIEFVTTTARSRRGTVHLLLCRWIWITDEEQPAFFYHYPQFLNWRCWKPTSKPSFKPAGMPLPNYLQHARTGYLANSDNSSAA